MTVPAAPRRAGPFVGNDVTTDFDFDFKVFAAADIRAVLAEIATGDETDLVLDSDYSVTLNPDQDSDPGGTITYPISGSPMAATHSLTVVSNMEIEQETDLPNQGPFFGETVEDALDRVTMLIGQQQEELERAVKVPVTSSTDPDDLIEELVDAASDAEAAAAAAAASADAAADSETNAAASETAAAQSVIDAQAIVDSVGFRDVVFKTFADTPIVIDQTYSGKLVSIDTSGGNVAVTMPQISGLVLPFTVGVKKTTGDANTVVCTRSGTDTFDDGATTLTFSVTGGAALIPDTDTAPDKWSVASFGPVSGTQVKQQFTAGVGFTAGVSTTITINETPIPSSKDAITIYQDGVYQQESEWSYAAGTGVVTFTSVIGASVAKIECVWVAPLAIGTPADASVSTAKIADSNVTTAKIADGAVTRAKLGYFPRGHLAGCALSNNGSDATNDIDIAAGECVDSTQAALIVVAALTKRLDADWSAGTGNGMRYSGAAITDTTYHIWAVAKADGTQDIYATPTASASTASGALTLLQAESGGSAYIYARRLGSIVRTGAAIKAFSQDGDEFLWLVPVLDVNVTNPGTSAVTRTLTVPLGATVRAVFNAYSSSGAGISSMVLFSALAMTDAAASSTAAPLVNNGSGNASSSASTQHEIRTNTSGQIRSRSPDSDANTVLRIATVGYIDRRGKGD